MDSHTFEEQVPLVDGVHIERRAPYWALGRRAALVGTGLLVVFAIVAAFPARGRMATQLPADAGAMLQQFDVGAELQLGNSISPVSAIKQSMKKSVVKVEGAFTGGTCTYTENETCPFADMQQDKLTGVFPGGATSCLVGEKGSPYVFQVIPGASDKLIIYFSGGGACWDEMTASQGLCSRACGFEGKPDTPDLSGIFDHSRKDNPYREYTVVILGYCTGDAHVGTQNQQWTIRPFKGEPGGDIAHQRGYTNARTAIDWVHINFPDQLDSLVIGGSSAGSLGAQIWANTLLKEFKYDNAAVIADSYACIFPTGTQGPMMRDFGLCTTDLLPSSLQSECTSGLLDVQQIFEQTMQEYPKVTFASIDSKTDLVQMAFYDVVYASKVSLVNAFITPESFSQTMSMIHARYNMQPNWVSYLVNGNQHMYLNNDVMFQTSPVGNVKTGKPGQAAGALLAGMGLEISGGKELWLTPWLSKVPVAPGSSLKSACSALKRKSVPTLPPLPSFMGGFGSILHTGATVVGNTIDPLIEQTADKLGWNHCDAATTAKIFYRPS